MPWLRKDRPVGGKGDRNQLVPEPDGLFHRVQLWLAWAGSKYSDRGG